MGILVLLTDFGLKEHFVGTMKGVALSVDPTLNIHDLTHRIPPYNIWEASVTLAETLPYWPPATVFVAVVDPGVGMDRRSVVAKTEGGHYIVCPDNGLLTFVEQKVEITEVREIDEQLNRRPGSGDFHTFHGRDVYAFAGARLAAGAITFEQVGSELSSPHIQLPFHPPEKTNGNGISGTILKIEYPFGNVVTNIPHLLIKDILGGGTSECLVKIIITEGENTKFDAEIPFTKSFGYVEKGHALAYIDSSARLGVALNQGDFARSFGIKAGDIVEVNFQ